MDKLFERHNEYLSIVPMEFVRGFMQQIRHLVLNILPNSGTLPVPTDHCLFRVVVNDGKNDTSIGHFTTAFYGIPLLASQDSIHKEIFQ